MIVETLKLLIAAYLILLAIAAALGEHRELLALPGRSAYALLRIALYALTLGRVRLVPPARQAFRRGRWRARSISGMITDRRERSAEERALASGEAVSEPPQWVSTASARPLSVDSLGPADWDLPSEEPDPRALRPIPPLDE